MGLDSRRVIVEAMRAAMLREGERLAYMAHAETGLGRRRGQGAEEPDGHHQDPGARRPRAAGRHRRRRHDGHRVRALRRDRVDHPDHQPDVDDHQQQHRHDRGRQRRHVQRASWRAARSRSRTSSSSTAPSSVPVGHPTSSPRSPHPTLDSARAADGPPRRAGSARHRRAGCRRRGAAHARRRRSPPGRATRRRSSTRRPTSSRPPATSCAAHRSTTTSSASTRRPPSWSTPSPTRLVRAMVSAGAYRLKEHELRRLERVIFNEMGAPNKPGAINPAWIGKNATDLLGEIGVDVEGDVELLRRRGAVGAQPGLDRTDDAGDAGRPGQRRRRRHRPRRPLRARLPAHGVDPLHQRRHHHHHGPGDELLDPGGERAELRRASAKAARASRRSRSPARPARVSPAPARSRASGA